MPMKAFVIAIILGSLSLSAAAREVDWTTELVTDAAVGAATIAVANVAPDDARYRGGDFPTQAFDDNAHRALHGKPTGSHATRKEVFYREASNVSVVTASLLPATLALVDGGDELAGRVLTSAHALLISNLAVTSLKVAVRRPRPKARQEPSMRADGDEALSFPSGHAAAAFCGATLVSGLFPDAPSGIKASAFALAGFTALARIEGDKHFLTDVVTGGAIGAASAYLALNLYETRGGFRATLSPSTAGLSLVLSQSR